MRREIVTDEKRKEMGVHERQTCTHTERALIGL